MHIPLQVYKVGELDETSTCSKMEQVASDSKNTFDLNELQPASTVSILEIVQAKGRRTITNVHLIVKNK